MAKKKKTTSNPTSKNTTSTEKLPKAVEQSTAVASTNTSYSMIGWLFAFLGAALYFNTLGHQFAFDDSIVITGNSFTKEGFGGIYDLFTRDFFEGIYGEQAMDLTGGRYRPLSLIMFAIEYQFFPDNPFVGHLINILFYGLTGFMLFKVLTNWLDKTEGGVVIAFITTLLFIIHPIHTEVVANIKSRDEILGFLLILVTFHGIYKVIKEDNKRWLGIALGAFFLAMLSKENAFTFVVLIPLSLFVFQKMELNKAITFSIPFFVVAIAYIALRTFMLYKAPIPGQIISPTESQDIMENPFVGADLATRLATIGVLLLHYVMLLFLPHPMSCDYSFNQIPWTSFGDIQALLGWGIYLGMGIYAAVKIWKQDIVALGVLLYLAPLSLVINLFFNIGAPMADRFLYVPSFGFCLIMAYLVVKFGKVYDLSQLKKNLPIAGVLLLITIAASAKTINRNPAWHDNATLFKTDVTSVPNSAKIHYYNANSILKEFLDLGQEITENPTPEAMALLNAADSGFRRSIEINPVFHHSSYNIGLVSSYKKNGAEALKWLNYTLEIQPRHTMSHQELVKVYGKLLNQPEKAMEHLKTVLSIPQEQKNAANYQHLGILNAMKGNFAEAETAFLKAASLDAVMAKSCYRNLAGMYGNMATMAQNQGDFTKMEEYNNKAQAYNQKAQ